jgi:deoxyribodipyrimidine photo-lyase
VKEYEARVVANDSTYWLLFELLWRDFFRFAPLDWGRSMFLLWGPRGEKNADRTWKQDKDLLAAWATGTTGWPFVDANMRELLRTGFMSNRGRQNVASFLTRDMEVDWRMGGELFEALLIDHDPGANYGNWTYVAGVGADPREDRYFLIPKQSRDYDRDAGFMRHWLQELHAAGAATEALHDPMRLPLAVKQKANYPNTVVRLLAQRQGRDHNPKPHGGGGGGGGGGSGGGGRGGKGGNGGNGGGNGGRNQRGSRADAATAMMTEGSGGGDASAASPSESRRGGGGGGGKKSRVAHLR